MMQRKPQFIRWLIPVLVLGWTSGITLAPAQTDMPQVDALAGLKTAISNAGATALSSTEESSINALVTQFGSAHQPSPNTALQSAQTAFENAILAGDSSTAASQASIIANTQAADMAQRETDAAALAISVITLLKTGGQLDAMTAQLGANRVVRLVLNLAGWPGGGGPGGPPPGF
jgi:hypothetical protein